jgi:hypothetical protein
MVAIMNYWVNEFAEWVRRRSESIAKAIDRVRHLRREANGQFVHPTLPVRSEQARLMFGALELAEYPTPIVELGCTRCNKRGQYQRDELIAKHGRKMALPDLRHALAKCARDGKEGQACGVYYVDLVEANSVLISQHE